MKVIMLARPDLLKVKGGDTVQIINTKKALEREGISVDLSFDLKPNLTGYDIAHIFNLARPQEPFLHARWAKRHGIPIVMSTIYWNMEKVNIASARYNIWKRILGKIALNENLKTKILGIRDAILGNDPGYALRVQRKIGLKNQQREILELCDILLPNSKAEAEMIELDFGFKKSSYIVPNAVDPSIFSITEEMFNSRSPFVLSVGNLTIRKNQTILIKAVREIGLHLVLVGDVTENQKRYCEECIRECRRNGFEYLGPLPIEKILPLYYSAKVHALVSWVETPGLANLEAGICGCNIVSTKIGGTREYFEDFAYYCDPGDYKSIKNAILSAYNAQNNRLLSDHIIKNFTWDKAAKETINAYEEVLNTR